MAYTTIDDPSAYFKVQLYSGNGTAIGSGGQAITFDDTDTDMQPDLVWVKSRTDTQNHNMSDSVRGGTKTLYVNSTYFEETKTEAIASFQSDGFTVGNWEQVNDSGDTFVAWCWKESATAGFDIVSYTGNGSAGKTVSHSLSAVPDFFFLKNRSTASTQWVTWGSWMANTNALYINLTNALGTSQTYLNSTTPTSSVITLGGGNDENKDTDSHILYAWKAVQGFSKFGTYEGNGNNDGTFVYTGFRPAFVLLKASSTIQGWFIVDNKRPGSYNPIDGSLHSNATAAEDTASDFFIDFTSNGFKLRDDDTQLNGSYTYVYAAFAEAPFVNSNGVPCNAR